MKTHNAWHGAPRTEILKLLKHELIFLRTANVIQWYSVKSHEILPSRCLAAEPGKFRHQAVAGDEGYRPSSQHPAAGALCACPEGLGSDCPGLQLRTSKTKRTRRTTIIAQIVDFQM